MKDAMKIKSENKRFVRRTWGWYLVLINARRFKVKLLHFNMGESCSKQLHHYRNELWLFLTGKGIFGYQYMNKGDWINVPKKTKHQYYAILHTLVLEIQYGDKCDEEDIVRV